MERISIHEFKTKGLKQYYGASKRVYRNSHVEKLLRMWNDLHYLSELSTRTKLVPCNEEFLNKNPHHIGDCGGYDFEFDVWEYNIDGNHIEITLLINDSRGTVVLMDDGGLMNLFDARTNDEFGWEVENEIQDCLSENLAVYLEEKLGYSFVFDNILYTSDGKR